MSCRVKAVAAAAHLTKETTIMKKCIYTLSALAIASALSFGQEPPKAPETPGSPPKRERPNPEEVFKKIDKNADGSIDLAEFKESPMGKRDEAKAEERFKKLDKDSDGKVTLEEFKAGSHRRPGGPPKDGAEPAPK